MNCGIGSIPKHKYIWVDTKFTHQNDIGFIPAVWFGLVSLPGRAWGLNIMFENGAVYRSVPPNAISFSKQPKERFWSIKKSELWDCYGYDWHATEYSYLKGLKCKASIKNEFYSGDYLFTVVPLCDGFSEAPEQSKEFKFIRLDNDRLTIQPTNKVLFIDKSFTEDDNQILTAKLKLQTEIYSVENE